MSKLMTFPLSQSDFEDGAAEFLVSRGFPTEHEYFMFYGQAIQEMQSKGVDITEESLETAIRGRQTYRLAYFLIEDARKAFAAQQKAEKEQQSGSQEAEGTAKVLELSPKS